MTSDELSERLLVLAVRVGNVVENLPETRLGRHIAGQLIRCGTSAAPNYEEARAAESRRDFVHKLQIALKELRETGYWLRLSIRSGILKEAQLTELLDECVQLQNITAKSIVTARRNGVQKSERPTGGDERP
ncbi:MAG: four helix bundle protein [Planctomyces sp.]|nr:four helix bundle protein [Planctomyces sp.]